MSLLGVLCEYFNENHFNISVMCPTGQMQFHYQRQMMVSMHGAVRERRSYEGLPLDYGQVSCDSVISNHVQLVLICGRRAGVNLPY